MLFLNVNKRVFDKLDRQFMESMLNSRRFDDKVLYEVYCDFNGNFKECEGDGDFTLVTWIPYSEDHQAMKEKAMKDLILEWKEIFEPDGRIGGLCG